MDYNKELIEKMKDCAEMIKQGRTFGRAAIEAEDIILDGVDAIKTLLAEREAAVEDLHRMHTLCMDIGGCCPECGNQIDELMDAACSFCKGPGVSCWKDCPKDSRRCAAFEWRGPTPPDRQQTEK